MVCQNLEGHFPYEIIQHLGKIFKGSFVKSFNTKDCAWLFVHAQESITVCSASNIFHYTKAT